MEEKRASDSLCYSSSVLTVTQNPVDDLKLSLDGSRLAIATSSLTGKIWNGEVLLFEHIQHKRTYPTRSGNSEIAWCGDKGELLAAGGDDGSLQVWQSTDPSDTPKASFLEHDDLVSAVAANSVKIELLASGSWDTKVKLWNITKAESLATLEGHLAQVHSVSWGNKSDHLLFTAAQDCMVKQWDIRQQECVHTITHRSPVLVVETSPHNEHIVATGEEDPIITLHDLRKPDQPVAVEGHVHEDSIRCLCFAPHTPAYLACASDDTTISVYAVETGRTVFHCMEHKDFVRGLAWSSEQKGDLISGGWDRKVFIHSVSHPSG